MKTFKKISASVLLGFIFFSLSVLMLPLETKAAGCAFSCKEGSEDITTYCKKLYGDGSRVGKTFVTNGSPDCNMSEAPQCGLTAVAACCCAPDDSIITPYDPSTYAGTTGNEPNKPRYERPKLQVDIPGINFSDVTCVNKGDGSFVCSVSWISDYIGAIYQYALGIGGVLAAVMLMAGGLMWLISGGDASRVSKAKTLITGSVTGLIILFASYTILYQVNPDLTVFKPLQIRNIAPDTEPFSLAGNLTNSDECSDCIKITTIPVKSGNSSMANKDLIAKLEKVYQATSAEMKWRVTEAWPPTQKHKSKCHNNGTCVDIALLSSNNSCANVAKLQQALSNVGFDQILNEYIRCEGKETTYTSGDHLHIR